MAQTPSKLADRYVETEIDDEIVVMRLSDGHMFSLVGTSREIWQRLDGQQDIAALADELAELHGAPPETVRADVAEFVAELCGAGLVELA